MFRRAFNLVQVRNVTLKSKLRKRSRVVIHASQRPAESDEIDFTSLGLKFPLTHKPDFVVKQTLWSPKPESTPNLPFFVERSDVGSALPVYTDYKAGRTKVVTLLRKCKGDIEALKEDLEKVVGKPVMVRPGKIVIDGNFHLRVKRWLAGLGF